MSKRETPLDIISDHEVTIPHGHENAWGFIGDDVAAAIIKELEGNGYKIIDAKRVANFSGVDVISKDNLDLVEKELHPNLIAMRSMVLAGRMAKEMVNGKAFAFTDRDNANGGKFVNGEITVILPEE